VAATPGFVKNILKALIRRAGGAYPFFATTAVNSFGFRNQFTATKAFVQPVFFIKAFGACALFALANTGFAGYS
jgi:hypothetical protein